MLTSICCLAFAPLMFFMLVFLVAVFKRDNSLVDIAWGLSFSLLALLGLGYSQFGIRQFVVALLVVIWGTRLAIHIYLRNRGRGEDFRYRKWRKDWGNWWVIRSFFQIYLLQWLLMLLVSTPIILVMLTPTSPFWLLDYLGVIVWLIGFFFEAIGDWQLTRFKQDPRNKNRLMTKGLWSLTRHPNYFGEASLWWGIAILAFAQTNNLFVFLGPLTIDYLLLKVSGIPLLEKKYQGRADWDKYAAKTSAFFPLPPSK